MIVVHSYFYMSESNLLTPFTSMVII